jgi:hypothetical protein
MNRFRLCATIVAALSVVSFSARALIVSSDASRSSGPSITEPAGAQETALGPDGKPVRVISFSTSDHPASAAVAPLEPRAPELAIPEPVPSVAMPVAAQLPPAVAVQARQAQAEPEAHSAQRAHPVQKRIAAAPAKTRVASAQAHKPFTVLSGLW